MAKYSLELKLMIVQDYQRGYGGYGYLAEKYGIADKWQVKRWIKAYEKLGADGLKRSRQQTVICDLLDSYFWLMV